MVEGEGAVDIVTTGFRGTKMANALLPSCLMSDFEMYEVWVRVATRGQPCTLSVLFLTLTRASSLYLTRELDCCNVS